MAFNRYRGEPIYQENNEGSNIFTKNIRNLFKHLKFSGFIPMEKLTKLMNVSFLKT